MDENKKATNGDYATAAIPTDFCCSSLTPRQMLAGQLREMSLHVSDIDRCTLCKAAEELSKPQNSGTNWMLPMLALMFSNPPGGGDGIDPDGMKAYMDAVDKKREQKPGGIKP